MLSFPFAHHVCVGTKVDHNEAPQLQVVEEQVDVEIVIADFQVELSADKGESLPEFPEESFDFAKEIRFELAFVEGLFKGYRVVIEFSRSQRILFAFGHRATPDPNWVCWGWLCVFCQQSACSSNCQSSAAELIETAYFPFCNSNTTPPAWLMTTRPGTFVLPWSTSITLKMSGGPSSDLPSMRRKPRQSRAGPSPVLMWNSSNCSRSVLVRTVPKFVARITGSLASASWSARTSTRPEVEDSRCDVADRG